MKQQVLTQQPVTFDMGFLDESDADDIKQAPREREASSDSTHHSSLSGGNQEAQDLNLGAKCWFPGSNIDGNLNLNCGAMTDERCTFAGPAFDQGQPTWINYDANSQTNTY